MKFYETVTYGKTKDIGTRVCYSGASKNYAIATKNYYEKRRSANSQLTTEVREFDIPDTTNVWDEIQLTEALFAAGWTIVEDNYD